MRVLIAIILLVVTIVDSALNSLPAHFKKCGYRNINGIGAVSTDVKNYNGTKFGEFPWLVAVIRIEKVGDHNLNVYQCAGSLIHPRVVLTAADCVAGMQLDAIRIRAGEWDVRNNKEQYPHQDRSVAEIVIHEYFHNVTLMYNIGLLFLQSPFHPAENVQTICLPPAGLTFKKKQCYVTGWGKNVSGKNGRYAVKPKKISLTIVSNNQCVNKMHPFLMCAVGEEYVCTGDDGSPLVCRVDDGGEQYYQAGIVIRNTECKGGVPKKYSDVSKMRMWLDKHLRARNIESAFYSA